MSKADVYWNHGKGPIFITTNWQADPSGGPAERITEICVAPGQGVDLSILGLSKKEPKKMPACQKCGDPFLYDQDGTVCLACQPEGYLPPKYHCASPIPPGYACTNCEPCRLRAQDPKYRIVPAEFWSTSQAEKDKAPE